MDDNEDGDDGGDGGGDGEGDDEDDGDDDEEEQGKDYDTSAITAKGVQHVDQQGENGAQDDGL